MGTPGGVLDREHASGTSEARGAQLATMSAESLDAIAFKGDMCERSESRGEEASPVRAKVTRAQRL